MPAELIDQAIKDAFISLDKDIIDAGELLVTPQTRDDVFHLACLWQHYFLTSFRMLILTNN